VISSCNAPDSIVKKYKDDADRLAVRRVFYVNSTFKDSIEINKPISKKYQNALLAVYNATTLPARDTVVNAFKIHAYCNPGMNYIVIQADTNTIWVKNLIHNNVPTGQPQFDYLLSKYYLHKINYFGYSAIQNIVMKTDTNYNTDALSQKFGLISGVTSYADDCFSDVRDITDSINSNFTLLTYKYGWGDCPSGCGSHRYWQFKIFNNCSVEYLGSYGDPITPPAFVGLQELKASVDNVKIYPNPIKGKLNVEFIIQPQISYLNITNSFGQLIFEKNNLNQKQEIDLSFLGSGIYYLKVQNNSEQKIFKIIKE
jgi:translation elongation factor EF-1beta